MVATVGKMVSRMTTWRRTTISLRWSASGQTLRLHTPDGEESVGTWAANEAWAPASPLSPDGRYAIFFGRNMLFVMHSMHPTS
jgi:hypothetical protein